MLYAGISPSGSNVAQGRLGGMQCPQLGTLTLFEFGNVLRSLVTKPMQNVHRPAMCFVDGPVMFYLKLLEASSNLASLPWRAFGETTDDGLRRVALQSLESLTFASFQRPSATPLLASLYVSSLASLDFNHCHSETLEERLNEALDTIYETEWFRCASPYTSQHGRDLFHRYPITQNDLVDELFKALSPHHRDSQLCMHVLRLKS